MWKKYNIHKFEKKITFYDKLTKGILNNIIYIIILNELG